MFQKILIANRGEIALRIIRACRELGIQTVVVYSTADADAAYLKLADQAICIGEAPPAESYLNIPRIISAAEISDVEAIHPGYGFLSEKHHFAEICRSCKIEFIGPPVDAMLALGDKVQCKKIARKARVPTVPGSEGAVEDEAQAVKIAREIGYPVIIKAAAGGGGRGMRVAHNEISLRAGIKQAQAEAENAFKDPTVYIEKYVEFGRHVEVQVIADQHGNACHLWERDCSMQRRHQKLVEESPSPVLRQSVREELCAAAVRLIREAGYYNAGTVEFLVDRDQKFYLLEVNARIQVEHPVTECVTGLDLIKEQIRVASGQPLSFRQKDVEQRGHAIECRINAEDPARNFAPFPGRIEEYRPPGGPGVRLDSHVYAGYRIPPNYDSMIGKLIVHRPTREQAIATMKRALSEFHISPIRTTIPIHLQIMENEHFRRGEVDTGFVERVMLQR
ncbi:MAG: acetyl-CoA carboxylase biotin carboxylase subunit [Phycisphaerae bacterium]|nr:acetyl-CoA carboxylase biotin carboxylase subunit [Phycisphaerae bacterium]MDW8261352.1 acetyl-CoA carboxylase biotin carboxylase subunit [Phycisphaerales bacterium]